MPSPAEIHRSAERLVGASRNISGFRMKAGSKDFGAASRHPLAAAQRSKNAR